VERELAYGYGEPLLLTCHTTGDTMPVDFTKLGSAGGQKRTSPRAIFIGLPGKHRHYEYLRDGQGHVLDSWEERRSERDIIIKMNTGGGKTVVGLLILSACLNEDVGPALYVAPDTYLAEQVMYQAAELGIPTVSNPDDRRYLSGEAIAVVNAMKLINGRSVFGGPGSLRPRPLPIGTVVIDDAHAALATVDEQTTITLKSDHLAFAGLLDLFEADLREQAPGQLMAIKDHDPAALLQVPFWSWSSKTDQVMTRLAQARNDEALDFKWPLLRDILPLCQAVFSGESLQIKPPAPPIGAIASLEAAHRRVFLTATLADDSILVTAFDAAPESIQRPITPVTAADLGDRLILAPQEITPSISEQEVKVALAGLAREYNVVVLVPSFRRASVWGDVADSTVAKDEIADTVARLRTQHVGLVVLINKYDGIDLPDDACRVLVIDGLPEAYAASERRQAQVLGTALLGRQLQRVEQGMGRGVRSANDYCVIVLHGARLSECIAMPGSRQQFSPATRAQLDLAREIASQLSGEPLEELVGVMRQCLDREEGFVRASRDAVAGASYSQGEVSPITVHMRKAFNAACLHQYQVAAQHASAAVTLTADRRLRGWLMEQLAAYTDFFDAPQAQHILARATEQNSSVTRPRDGVSLQRLSAAQDQAQSSATYFAERFTEPNQVLVAVAAVLSDLEFDPERTGAFEDAMETLGLMLGFRSQRPERDSGNGPDVMWAIGGLQYLIIECKSGVTRDEISRNAVEQLGHSMSWFGERYSGCEGRPLLVHPVNQLADNAVAPDGARIVTRDVLGRLKSAVNRLTTALASTGRWDDATAIAEQLTAHQLNGPQFFLAYSIPSKR
jgi:hypothetical protein